MTALKIFFVCIGAFNVFMGAVAIPLGWYSPPPEYVAAAAYLGLGMGLMAASK